MQFQVRDETYTAFENIYPVLTEFRKNQQWYDIYDITYYFDIYVFTPEGSLTFSRFKYKISSKITRIPKYEIMEKTDLRIQKT